MTRINSLFHEFVHFIPEDLVEGVLYVSIPFATVVHKCCCGCGIEVVTPLDPTDWQMTFDGKSVSLQPSIGNWSIACRSHYWIKRNKVEWAPAMSEERITRIRIQDRYKKAEEFGGVIGLGTCIVKDATSPVLWKYVWHSICKWTMRRLHIL